MTKTKKTLIMVLALMMLATAALAAGWSSWKDGQDNTALCVTPGHDVHIYIDGAAHKYQGQMDVPWSYTVTSQSYSSLTRRTVVYDTGRDYGFDVDARGYANSGTAVIYDSWLTCEY